MAWIGLISAVVVALITTCAPSVMAALGKPSKLQKSVDGIGEKLDQHIAADDERNAISCRARILRASNEILRGDRLSKEHFDAVLLDVDAYEAYCERHPEFKNNVTVLTIEGLKATYQNCLHNNSFL